MVRGLEGARDLSCLRAEESCHPVVEKLSPPAWLCQTLARECRPASSSSLPNIYFKVLMDRVAYTRMSSLVSSMKRFLVS